MVQLRSLLASLATISLATATTSMGAVGIAVTDLSASLRFYTTALGFAPTGMAFNTTAFDEIVIKLPGSGTGSALVLMQYKTPKQNKDTGVKLVFYVDDMQDAWKKVLGAGAASVNAPGTLELGGTKIPTAFARDLDGYLVELNPVSIMGKGLPKGASGA